MEKTTKQKSSLCRCIDPWFFHVVNNGMGFYTARVKRHLAEPKKVQGGKKGDQKYGGSSIQGTTGYTRTIQCEKEIT